MSTICHECGITTVNESSREYNPSYGISILKRTKDILLISPQHHIVCTREYKQIIDGIRTLDEIEQYERRHPTNKDHPTLFVVTDKTRDVLEKRRIYVGLVAPEFDRFVSIGGESPKSERYSLPEYGFISPNLAKNALPNCFRDLTSRLDSIEWVDFEELELNSSV